MKQPENTATLSKKFGRLKYYLYICITLTKTLCTR